MIMIPFAKGHGLGNDYLVIEQQDLLGPLAAAGITRLCDRNRGVGSDGVLLLVPSSQADFGLRIFNPDGSEAEKSGNGLRIFARYLWDRGRTRQERFTVETRGGVVECQLHMRDGHVNIVTVEMGHASFQADQIPITGVDGEVIGAPIELTDGTNLEITAASVGNPHCVVFVERLDEGECRRVGPLLEGHARFPNRTNVQFARLAGHGRLDILIWERGAGYTLASGSSSCAAAAAAVRNGLCEHGLVRVGMPGGELGVEVRPDWSLRLEGPVEEVYTGALSDEFVNVHLNS